MTFIRINPPGQPLKEVRASALNIGIREGIIQAAIAKSFIKEDLNNNYDDKDLIRYSCSAGRQDWVEWLLKNADFYNSRGNVKKELKRNFDLSLILALEGGYHDIAVRLFGLGAKAGSQVHRLLYRSIKNGWHEMAELLFAKGGEIRQNRTLNECIHYADDRMKEIIRKGMISSINRRFTK